MLSILSSALSTKLGIPALVLFLGIGMLAGSDGPGGIFFEDTRLAQMIGVVALACILFSGGLDTDWSRIRPIIWQGICLANIGVVVSAAIIAATAQLML